MSRVTRARFAALLSESDPDPAELALLMACEAEPRLDLAAQLDRVDAIAERAAELGRTADAVVVTLRATGLQGDRRTYDDPRNSLLPQVLDRGVGLPITLSVLTVAVARRLGVPMTGVGLPGHFIVAATVGDGPRLYDPFHGWAALTRDDCVALVATTAAVPFRPEFLAPVDARAIMVRMLANLRGSYLRRRALRDALWTVELGLLAQPGTAALQRQLAVLLAGVGRYEDAESAAEVYLAQHPDAPDRDDLEHHLTAVRDLMGRMN